MQIKCPECGAKLSIGQPSPGSYRPKCKHCGKPFRLKVTDDDPPKVGIGRIRSASAGPASGGPDATHHAGVDATIDAVDDAAGQVEVRPGKAAVPQQTVGGDVDATTGGTIAGGQSPVGASTNSPAVSGRGNNKPGEPGTGVRRVAKQPGETTNIPERLGGYRILRLLGRGAMGAVYEAKQISLDRLVALKTIRGRLDNNPASLARFTREAYAAAQLTHHNVVQIYDFGEDDGRHFFSMEWVRGGPLDDLVREKGVLDPRLAAGYILQAARGLQFAHRNGMVHRDIKPANLLLSDDGVIKVADLGLVKIPEELDAESDVVALSGLESGTQVTMQGTAVGTPAYMAPEQGIDAAGVDHRADIYSLGCTLFYLLAGRPPFEGSVVSEVLQQHANVPPPRLVEINARVPATLEAIVQRSMAKRPEDRYPSLAEMIDDLESFLGLSPDGMFSPTSEQADQWEQITTQYIAAAPLMRLCKPMLAGLITISALLTVLMPAVGGLGWILLGPTLLVAASVTALVLAASGGHSAVVSKFRLWIGSLSWLDTGIGVFGGAVLFLVAIMAGMWPGLLVGGLLGVAGGVAYHFLVIAPSRRRREPVVADAQRFIRDLRIDGADEDGVRSFAARYAGKQWQSIFEELFGYDSLCEVRDRLRGDPSFAASTASDSWRDKICGRLATKAKTNRQATDHRRLAKIEQRGLQSEGVSADEARERAWQMAAAVMDSAKATAPTTAAADVAAEEKRRRIKAMLADARSGKYKKKRDAWAPVRFALGGQSRLLAGCLLLAIFAVWGNNSGLFDSLKDLPSLDEIDLQEVGSTLRESAAVANQSAASTVLGSNPWSVGIAGLLLSMSAFVSGWRMTPFAVTATMVILLGPTLGIPGVGDLVEPWMVSALVGLAIYLPGIVVGETKDAE